MIKRILTHNGQALILRDAVLEDIEALGLLAKLVNKHDDPSPLPFVQNIWLQYTISERQAGKDRHQLPVVTTSEGEIVGYTRFNHLIRKRDGFFQTTGHETVVHPDVRGQGIGRELVGWRLEHALNHIEPKRPHPIDCIVIQAPEDIPANHFHKKQGFVLVGQEVANEKTGRMNNVYALDLNEIRAKRQAMGFRPT